MANLAGKNISAVNSVVGLSVLFFSQSTHFVNLCNRLIWMSIEMGTIEMSSCPQAVTTSNTISEIIQEGVNV
jgi:predicted peroxiredoxin